MSNVRTSSEKDGSGERGPLVRIGELARRSGLPAGTLRAWERRYGVVSPVRGDSGYRLYSTSDERRVRAMARMIEAGLAPAEAAGRVVAQAEAAAAPTAPTAAAEGDGSGIGAELLAALLAFDEDAADRELDRAIASLSIDAVLGDVVLPVLREVGNLWSRGDADVSQEHFASGIVRGRLLGLARGWGGGEGRLAMLACPSGEAHDLGLICFGLILRSRGWRIAFLGADTPVPSILDAVERTRPDVTVLFAMDPEPFESGGEVLEGVAAGTDLLLAGPGVRPGAPPAGGRVLRGDPISAAVGIAA
jgi:DNA-binding transcriptional MerR regulator